MTAGTDAGRIAELDKDNARLRRLLDQQNAPGELRHRLRSTLSLLRAVVRKSAGTERELVGYVSHLEDRLDAIARAQDSADQHGEVSLENLLVDALFHYGVSEGERAALSGPDVRLQPRAGQVLALAIHELAVNAVEHGALGAATGRIQVSWSVVHAEPDTLLTLSWTEHGVDSDAESTHSGFGTEVLTRVLAYEFKATTDLVFGPNGIRVTISLPLQQRVGYVASQ